MSDARLLAVDSIKTRGRGVKRFKQLIKMGGDTKCVCKQFVRGIRNPVLGNATRVWYLKTPRKVNLF